ncbi:unnamed protein product, partial [Laminaria digitata]
MEFEGAGRDSSRCRPQVPTLGPLSYSLPAAPQGREEDTVRDGGAADLAREAAEGWSVPPMPFNRPADQDVSSGQVRAAFTGGQGDFPPAPATASAAAPPSRVAAFLGGGVSSGSSRSMRTDSSRTVQQYTHNAGGGGKGELRQCETDG